jgi:hypothetical protein
MRISIEILAAMATSLILKLTKHRIDLVYPNMVCAYKRHANPVHHRRTS